MGLGMWESTLNHQLWTDVPLTLDSLLALGKSLYTLGLRFCFCKNHPEGLL